MSNAYAERFRVLPVAVDRLTVTVATSEPFVRAWADDLQEMIKRE
jgi:general secretion pathway protein E